MKEEAQKSPHQCPNTKSCPFWPQDLATTQGRVEASSCTHATDRPMLQKTQISIGGSWRSPADTRELRWNIQNLLNCLHE